MGPWTYKRLFGWPLTTPNQIWWTSTQKRLPTPAWCRRFNRTRHDNHPILCMYRQSSTDSERTSVSCAPWLVNKCLSSISRTTSSNKPFWLQECILWYMREEQATGADAFRSHWFPSSKTNGECTFRLSALSYYPVSSPMSLAYCNLALVWWRKGPSNTWAKMNQPKVRLLDHSEWNLGQPVCQKDD